MNNFQNFKLNADQTANIIGGAKPAWAGKDIAAKPEFAGETPEFGGQEIGGKPEFAGEGKPEFGAQGGRIR